MRRAAVHAGNSCCSSIWTPIRLARSRSLSCPSPCLGTVRQWAAVLHQPPTQRSISSQSAIHSLDEGPISSDDTASNHDILDKLAKLPQYCPGCGAPSQIVSREDAGFYTLTRQGLRKFFHESTRSAAQEEEASIINHAESSVICDRCHHLLHHSEGVPIFHPSIQSIHDIIAESPHKYNHIYHILDAADLPMSLIPSLQADLRLPRLRSQNRRSKHTNFTRGRSAEVSFIITRADLLAPKKEQVDSLLPYIREVLRDALGQTRKNVRLGNLRCVSAKRGWWTSHIKEDIWKRGGAGWMVGKVNVGKSSLFEVVFPKGRVGQISQPSTSLELAQDNAGLEQQTSTSNEGLEDEDLTGSLLPPARQEVAYPAMPISSALPGTTASPIRVPFGSGRGELIDLPGVARSSLETYVVPSERESLVMRSRIAAEQRVIKPGQSLLLGGGLIRITPTTPNQVVMAYPFLPLKARVTSTAKALEIQAGTERPGLASILVPEAHKTLASAGPMPLKWDITRVRSGPLTSKSDVKLKPSQLAFSVWGADVVVEGVGWVELVAQTRKKKAFTDSSSSIWSMEVFSPEGKYVALRRPMNAWLLGGRRVKSKTPARARPRRSMTSLKHSRKGRDMAAASQD
ncbi:hypothetical protein ANO11243_025620 [Dothideomycetidae sp. 11243]|nr:hypothetical protein ANO11243_025620 [fungal sp. No.11243]